MPFQILLRLGLLSFAPLVRGRVYIRPDIPFWNLVPSRHPSFISLLVLRLQYLSASGVSHPDAGCRLANSRHGVNLFDDAAYSIKVSHLNSCNQPRFGFQLCNNPTQQR